MTTSNNNPANISDGYHTFGELYEHRHALFLALTAACGPGMSYRGEVGDHFPGWFLVGMNLPTGQISYHLPEEYYPLFGHCKAEVPEWDGHTPAQVVERLHAWVRS